MGSGVENNANEKICRLCGEMQQSPLQLFTNNSLELDQLVGNILNYVGIKLVDDGLMPNWLCIPCHLEAESTCKFLQMIASGQQKLEQLKQSVDANKEDQGDSRIQSANIHKDGSSKTQTKSFGLRKRKIISESIANIKACTSEKRTRGLVGNSVKSSELEEPNKITLGEELPSSSLISDTSEPNSNILNPKEPFAELRSADGDVLATIIVVDTDSKGKAHSTIPKIHLICEFCKGVFLNRDFRKHLRTHNYCAYECTECLKSYQNKNEFNQHQKKAGHQGLGIIEHLPESNSKKEKKATTLTKIPDSKANEATINIIVDDNGEFTFIDSDSAANLAEDAEINTAASSAQIKRCPIKEQPAQISFYCLKCEKAFSSHYAVLRHYNHVHIGVRLYKCKLCTASFKHQTNYAYHIAKHTGYRKFKCVICPKAFRQKCELDLHMRTHTGDKPYKCEFCDKAFAHRSNMVTHIRLHTGQQPFKCETCGSIFNSSSHWKSHKAVHLKHELHKLQESNTYKNKTTHLPCKTSLNVVKTKKTSTTTLLKPKRAVVNSIEILPPIQNIKDYKIPENVNAAEYRITHAVEPPHATQPLNASASAISAFKFECSQCLQHFKQKSSLTKHMRTHTNEKPYKCPHCPRAFADPSNFKRHKLLHRTASEQIQNASAQLNQQQQVQRERQKQSLACYSPAYSVASDPDPDGLEANERAALVSIANSNNELEDDSSFLDIIENVVGNPVIVDDIYESTRIKSSKVVCISYPDPANPDDNNVTTFFVPN